MTQPTDSPWLSRFAIATAVAALSLICVGGLVTSHGAGLAVPDWPTTYGHNMFTFPLSQWTGGIFYEHSHRLLAAAVGFLTILLALWLWRKEERRWVRNLGWAALGLVIAQGVLGGLRVTELMSELGIFHAILAQLFLVLVCAIALLQSRLWQDLRPQERTCTEDYPSLNRLYVWATVLVLAQLVVAAAMRHQHAGLAIPDFPLAYGRLWPALDADAIVRYNQLRTEVNALNPITASQVWLHLSHRILALIVLMTVLGSALATRRRMGPGQPLTKLSSAWLVLIVAQIALGATTVWTGKAPSIATLHVAVGALTLVAGAMLVLLAHRLGALSTDSATPASSQPPRPSFSPAPIAP